MEIPFYKSLPCFPVLIDRNKFPDLLKFDIFSLCGLMPITTQIAELCPEGIGVQPTQEVISYYCVNNIRFLMVAIVVNCCIFTEDNSILRGYPYSVSLFPASKRNRLDYVDARFAATFDLENMPTKTFVYLNYDPFCGDWDLCGSYDLFAGRQGTNPCFSDSVGFVIGIYFLADRFDVKDILLPDMAEAPHNIRKKYRRFRIKRYFNAFANLQPRRVWGVDSPIELFLMQGLIALGFSPVPQYLIYEDGSVYPSFHDIFLDDSFSMDQALLTEVDFYFPDHRLAIFCDSDKYHRTKKDREKDSAVSAALHNLGISTLRIPGPMIVRDIDRALNIVADKLNG